MNAEKQLIELADGRELTVRTAVSNQDQERMIGFFSGLPQQLRNYLRYNVLNPELCRRRLDLVDEQNHWRLIAELDSDIVGESSMDREPFGWTHHIAHVRVVVDPKVASLGIGTILLRRMVEMGSAAGVERFYSEVIKEHTDMIRALEEQGFVREATRVDYARDLKGRLHDVVIMSIDRSEVWQRLQESIDELEIMIPSIYRGA